MTSYQLTAHKASSLTLYMYVYIYIYIYIYIYTHTNNNNYCHTEINFPSNKNGPIVSPSKYFRKHSLLLRYSFIVEFVHQGAYVPLIHITLPARDNKHNVMYIGLFRCCMTYLKISVYESVMLSWCRYGNDQSQVSRIR